MDDGHTPVICISDIPEATLDSFLQCIENFVEKRKKQFFGVDDCTLSDEIAFITSKDLSTITSGATRPAKAFRSPFVGESIKQVGDWFVRNIVPSDGYTRRAFVVMDSRTAVDNTCVVVCAIDDEVESLRCDFDVAQLQINSLEFGSEGMREGLRAWFFETGEVMTKEKFDLALKGRLYPTSRSDTTLELSHLSLSDVVGCEEHKGLSKMVQ